VLLQIQLEVKRLAEEVAGVIEDDAVDWLSEVAVEVHSVFREGEPIAAGAVAGGIHRNEF
jgi:hypothetical protein